VDDEVENLHRLFSINIYDITVAESMSILLSSGITPPKSRGDVRA
jgi:hypothetical protein